MTVLALLRTPNALRCYTDSLVTRGSGRQVQKTTDKFSKIMLLPYHATVGRMTDNDTRSFRGELGFAFCGDVLFATALYTMSSNMFLNLHWEEGDRPPYLKGLAEGVAQFANALLEDYVVNAMKRNYQVVLFGYCPVTSALEAFLISFDFDRQPVRYESTKIELQVGQPFVLGSGAEDVYRKIQDLGKGNHKLPEILLDVIRESENPTVGGALQECCAQGQTVKILPVAQPINDEMNLDYFISGTSAQQVPNVEEFRFGREMVGYKNEVVLENQWLQSIGFGKDRSTNPPSANTQAEFMRHAQLSQQGKKPMCGIHSYLKVWPAKAPIFDNHYFFGRCDGCNRPFKMMEDSTNGGNPEPFFGEGGFEATCPYCSATVLVPAKGLRSKKDKRPSS
ncbi:hypothetical protein ROSMUCSMR3_03587 [Roseovarius mucosus]|uniref:Uncharacterized protein n=2 Tax=Roseovarius mucosus TaxID=215743 RepID=A0A1V0RTF6_9RHOB|nr:hypothetical protein ROSMUCSMR3_03587 [Roseovarius mucosus]